MKYQISYPFLLIIFMSLSGFASESFVKYQKLVSQVKETTISSVTSAMCDEVTQISNTVEREIFDKSCPTSSEMDFNLCQQRADSLSITETQQLQDLLSEIKVLNTEKCMNKDSNGLIAAIN